MVQHHVATVELPVVTVEHHVVRAATKAATVLRAVTVWVLRAVMAPLPAVKAVTSSVTVLPLVVMAQVLPVAMERRRAVMEQLPVVRAVTSGVTVLPLVVTATAVKAATRSAKAATRVATVHLVGMTAAPADVDSRSVVAPVATDRIARAMTVRATMIPRSLKTSRPPTCTRRRATS
ncbi:hypothetical protein GCM10027421_37460 [Microbacterium shaanxiense]